MQRTIMHIDMDAFFASVEVADNPELAGKPVIIGKGKRGVVSACSYEARAFGVHSAMPVGQARRLCPHGIFLAVRGERYREVSREVMSIIHSFSPLVEQTSVDEAYVDITGTEKLYGAPRELAMLMKAEIKRQARLTCSVGIAPNRFLAKISSDMDKPDGIYIIEPERVTAFVAVLPVGKVPGIGPKMRKSLERYHIKVMGDILRYDKEFLFNRFGERAGYFLWERAHGRGTDILEKGGAAKSRGAENTFSNDTLDMEFLENWLWRQSERVGRSLRKRGQFGRAVTLKLKDNEFKIQTRNCTLDAPTNTTSEIFEAVVALLRKRPPAKPIRLIGVSVSHLSQEEGQLSLLADKSKERTKKLDAALDAITARFGKQAVATGRHFDLEQAKKNSS